MKKFTLFSLLLFVVLSCTWASLAATLTITVSDNAFTPNGVNPPTVTVNIGDTVSWVWGTGASSHTTTSTTVPGGATGWNATIASSSPTFSYVPAVTGTYHYACTAHASIGMTGIFIVNCGAGPSRPIITSSNGNSACQDGTVHLSTAAQVAASYQWFNGVNPLPNTTNTLNVTSAGSYTVQVRRCSVDSTSPPFNVTIYPNPVPSFTTSHYGMNYSFTNTTPLLTSYTYLWTFSDGAPNQTTTNATRTFGSGSYTVSLKATSTITSCYGSNAKIIDTRLGVGTIGSESYSIAPNPVSSILMISTTVPASVYLNDLDGRRIVAPFNGDSRQMQVDISHLPAGLYFLHIATGSGSAVEKIAVFH